MAKPPKPGIRKPPQPDPAFPPNPSFIHGYPGLLSRDRCEAIIARFEADQRRHPSQTATRANPLVRSGTMLVLPRYPEWEDVCQEVINLTWACLQDYVGRYQSLAYLAHPDHAMVTPPIMERIEPGQGYGYHIDAGPGGTQDRLVSALLYLRDVEADGQTEFYYQRLQVVPQAGMLMLFPPFWTHMHRGVSPGRGVKYNLTHYLVIRPPAPGSR